MKKILVVSLMIVSLIAAISCGKDDAATTSTSTFTLQGSGS